MSQQKDNQPKKKVEKPKPKYRPAIKCCPYCQDYEYCTERNHCCEFCDHYFKGQCRLEEDLKADFKEGEFEMPDYRGDDYGIDDYSEYEKEIE